MEMVMQILGIVYLGVGAICAFFAYKVIQTTEGHGIDTFGRVLFLIGFCVFLWPLGLILHNRQE